VRERNRCFARGWSNSWGFGTPDPSVEIYFDKRSTLVISSNFRDNSPLGFEREDADVEETLQFDPAGWGFNLDAIPSMRPNSFACVFILDKGLSCQKALTSIQEIAVSGWNQPLSRPYNCCVRLHLQLPCSFSSCARPKAPPTGTSSFRLQQPFATSQQITRVVIFNIRNSYGSIR
jgi:hypothetical protein